MSDLPPDRYRLEALEYYLQQQLDAVRRELARLRNAETPATESPQRSRNPGTAYGYDARHWAGYPALRGIRELRLATFAIQIGDHNPDARREALHRIACLRGTHGPRPWHWTAVG